MVNITSSHANHPIPTGAPAPWCHVHLAPPLFQTTQAPIVGNLVAEKLAVWNWKKNIKVQKLIYRNVGCSVMLVYCRRIQQTILKGFWSIANQIQKILLSQLNILKHIKHAEIAFF